MKSKEENLSKELDTLLGIQRLIMSDITITTITITITTTPTKTELKA